MTAAQQKPTAQGRWVEGLAGHYATALSGPDLRQLARLVADTIAIAHYARANGIGATPFDSAGLTPGEVPVWGGAAHGLLDAAFLNGSAAEALDFQEVLIDGRNNGHAAVVIVPALLALAAARGLPGETLARGLRMAFLGNIGLARTLGRGHRSAGALGTPGIRTTSLPAPVAAALAGAMMLTGRASVADHAAAIAAASLPAGLLAAMSPLSGDFSVDKDLSVGFSARHAAHAALLAEAGATGPRDVLTGPRGWTASYGFGTDDPAHLDTAPDALDLRAYALKLYPANFGCQCAIRLAVEMSEGIAPDAVEGIALKVKSSSAASLSTRDLATHVAARFSLPYAVASAFARRRSVLADFEGAAPRDLAVQALMARVSVTGDDALEARHLSEGIFPAELTLALRDGRRITRALDSPQAGMDAAAFDAAVAEKIDSLCPAPLARHLKDTCAKAGDPAAFADFLTLPPLATGDCPR